MVGGSTMFNHNFPAKNIKQPVVFDPCAINSHLLYQVMREFDPVGILREAAEATLHSEDVGYLVFLAKKVE